MHDLVEDRGLMSRLASRALAIELLFNGEEPPLDIETRLAIEGLRATRRTEHEPVMEEWPAGIPTGMIVARDDRVCNPERAIAFSRDWLGVEPEVIDGSHMVIMTHPSIVADTIRKMIANKENYLPSHAAKQAA
jgi:pimeloyl-ACP methyl ester carboxylesterase